MVLVQRRSFPLASPCSPPSPEDSRPSLSPLTSPSEVKMGDGRHSPTEWMSQFSSSSSSAAFFPSPTPRRRSSYARRTASASTSLAPPNWRNRLLVLLSIASILYSFRTAQCKMSLAAAMEREVYKLQVLEEEANAALDEAGRSLSQVRRRREAVLQTRKSLEHEHHMLEEMREDGIATQSLAGATDDTLKNWMSERQHGLHNHLQVLRTFIQNQSRQAVLDKYGPGPHRVRVKVQIQTGDMRTQRSVPMDDFQHQYLQEFSMNRQQTVTQGFVLELASLDAMPHAVSFFLDSVDKKLWDDTVFLHNEAVDHVVAAVPMDYKTHSIKHEALTQLDQQTLAFPEYHTDYPHEEYTVGFAELGPTFYINTIDNTKDHGPGGQDHYRLPGDADPCFARIIEGQQAVASLIKFGLEANNRVKNGDHLWDGDHNWSRIVSAELIQPR